MQFEVGRRESEARVVLIEGLPGSGKTTMAEQLARERRASWAREEARDHPVLPASVRARNREDDFDALCLAQWRAFVEPLDEPWVLEGCALQSTVRFMFANEWSRPRIDAYWRAFEEIIRPRTEQLIVLPRDDDRIRKAFAERGEEWRRKVSAWVASTPRGGDLTEFWSAYGALCDDLISASTLPVMRL